MTRLYHWAVLGFSILFICIGFALLVRTAIEDGGAVGFVLGALFVLLGAGRLTVERRRRI
jgi:hypothetical protein